MLDNCWTCHCCKNKSTSLKMNTLLLEEDIQIIIFSVTRTAAGCCSQYNFPAWYQCPLGGHVFGTRLVISPLPFAIIALLCEHTFTKFRPPVATPPSKPSVQTLKGDSKTRWHVRTGRQEGMASKLGTSVCVY
jgi:hypothetical protein